MPVLAYDLTLRKVGCVLLQAVMGGDPEIAKRIPSEDWLLAPTPDLQVYRLTDADVDDVIRHHKGLPYVYVRCSGQ